MCGSHAGTTITNRRFIHRYTFFEKLLTKFLGGFNVVIWCEVGRKWHAGSPWNMPSNWVNWLRLASKTRLVAGICQIKPTLQYLVSVD